VGQFSLRTSDRDLATSESGGRTSIRRPERVDCELAGLAILAGLYELRDRAQTAIRSFSEQV